MTLTEIKSSKELTEKEVLVVDFLGATLSHYFGEAFSDVDCADIAKGLSMNIQTVKGVVGSLCKKEIVYTSETGTGFDVVLFWNQSEME